MVEIKDIKPVLNTLRRCLVLSAVDEPDEISESHFFWVLKLPGNLRKDPLHSFPGKSVAGILGKLLLSEKKIVGVVEFPKLDINNIKVFIAEIVSV